MCIPSEAPECQKGQKAIGTSISCRCSLVMVLLWSPKMLRKAELRNWTFHPSATQPPRQVHWFIDAENQAYNYIWLCHSGTVGAGEQVVHLFLSEPVFF